MAPYIILIIIIELTRFVSRSSKKGRFISSCICCMSLIAIFSLRHQSMGADLRWEDPNGYLASFEEISSLPFSLEAFKNYDIGYIWLNKLLAFVSIDRQWFLFSTSVFSIAPVGYIIYKYSKDIQTSYVIIFGSTIFLLWFSAVRQSIAIGIVLLSTKYLINRSFFKFSVIVGIASLIHHSALLFIFTFFIYNIKLNKVKKFCFIGFLCIFFSLQQFIFPFLSRFISNKGTALYFSSGSGMYFFLLLVILVYVYVSQTNSDSFRNGCTNIFFLGCVTWTFDTVNSLVGRVAIYYTIYLSLLIPSLNWKFNNNNLNLQSVAFNIVFIVLGMYQVIHGDWANSYPYYFFWNYK